MSDAPHMRGIVRDTSDPSGRTMFVLFDRALSDDEMRELQDDFNDNPPALATTETAAAVAVALEEAAKKCDEIAGNILDFPRGYSRIVGHCGTIVRALITPTGREALDAVVAQAVEKERALREAAEEGAVRDGKTAIDLMIRHMRAAEAAEAKLAKAVKFLVQAAHDMDLNDRSDITPLGKQVLTFIAENSRTVLAEIGGAE